MQPLLPTIRIAINPNLYVKDPESSDLGKRIVENGILMIQEMGFEQFTFRKLGNHIGSNESSVYRYFENKHKFLLYLTSWYWGWLEYKLAFATTNLPSPMEKLRRAIEILAQKTEYDSSITHINEEVLHKIVIEENSKSYLTKEVDIENKDGYFEIYKRLVNRLSAIIMEVKPGYQFPNSLASTVIEGSLHQHFLMEHFPSLTNCDKNNPPTTYLLNMVEKTLKAD